MKFAIALAALALSQNAHADGFRCQTGDQSLSVQIYNQVQPEKGTRVGAVMVLSDPSVSFGRKTIARFSETNGVLSNRSSRYEAKVDLRFNDSGRKGELILGTKLGHVDTIVADIDFSYAAPVAAGEEILGVLSIQKRDGSMIRSMLTCTRYLKSE